MASSNRIMMFVLFSAVLLSIISQSAVEADVHIGSCVWGAVDYTSNCDKECRKRGYQKGGHCGSFANVNCWCNQ